MGIPAVLVQQLLALEAPLREKIGRTLIEADDDECFTLAQQLIADLDDGLSLDERAELHARIAASTADIDAGRTTAYEDVMPRLRALASRRVAR
jgi:hypothetical protein